jgi:c-di-GMP-binding flagellar brake protein YcgR
MENRRQYFRQAIAPRQNIAVLFRTLDGTSSFSAEIVNLSIGGMCIKGKIIETAPEKRWTASFILDEESPPLTIPVERVYAHDDERGRGGFQFLPRTRVRDQEEQERIIWRFLIEEQRNDRRLAREARRSSA